jgi:pyruvate/2-oxoglutarate dehydrogenase complex dihydrolipoamide acyltransferase (E2) component
MAALKASGALERLQPGEHITAAMVNEALALTQTTPATPAEETTDTTLEVPAVSEPTTPAAETASTPTTAPLIALTQEQFTQLLDRITPARETAPAAAEPATETAPAAEPVAETDDQRVARLIAEGVKAAKDELREQLLRENGLPQRTGYRVHESEQPAADKEDVQVLFANRAETLLGNYGRTPQPAQ